MVAQRAARAVQAVAQLVVRKHRLRYLRDGRERHVEAREERDRLVAEAKGLDERVAAAEEALAAARAEGEKLEGAYRRHNELSRELAAAEAARERAAERASELRSRLEGLEED